MSGMIATERGIQILTQLRLLPSSALSHGVAMGIEASAAITANAAAHHTAGRFQRDAVTTNSSGKPVVGLTPELSRGPRGGPSAAAQR
ncbi:MAG: hypothetical protein B7Z74_06205 [Deltaproteobacteria bacterium 21-66-5]|nr:MAG: hypothetical protein B7Z74_06205 [Deltaproteobacteria bacterium 21-66-5]